MPYIIIAKDTDENELSELQNIVRYPDYMASLGHDVNKVGQRFATRADASKVFDPRIERIEFAATGADLTAWREREIRRLNSGEVEALPWSVEYGWRYDDHYAHVSKTKPGYVAYTKTVEHGVLDRQTIVRAGRYLTEFYVNPGHMTQAKADGYVADMGAKNADLKFAVTADEIVRVYSNGPTSCMDGRHSWRYGSPVQCYGNSDLQVAYIGDIDDVRARAVVWPANKVYQRAYGSTVITRLLEDAGYSEDTISGARIKRIPVANGRYYLMPYVDGIDSAEDLGDGWIMLGDGPLSTQDTCGYVDSDGNVAECSNCGARYDNSAEESSYCDDCENSRNYCDHCSEDVFNDDGASTADGYYMCESCCNSESRDCAIDSCNNSWVEEIEFTRSQRRNRQNSHTDDMCADCADHYVICQNADCRQAIDPDTDQVCPDCQTAIRCEHTADLLESVVDVPTAPVEAPTTPRTVALGCCCDTCMSIRATDSRYTIDYSAEAHDQAPTATDAAPTLAETLARATADVDAAPTALHDDVDSPF